MRLHCLSRPMNFSEAAAFMEACLDQGTEPEVIRDALLLLNQRGITGVELAAFAQSILAHAKPFHWTAPMVDTCGTGGDARQGVHTANLSTLAALALSTCDVSPGVPLRVAKHGNRSASSRCGSADLLEALGFPLDDGASKETPAREASPGPLSGGLGDRFRFLFAPHYHPVMARVAPIRRSLGVPTVFNMLGPLLNPARPQFQVLGVARREWMEPMAEALALISGVQALVVHGLTGEGLGMDEASVEGLTYVLPVRGGIVQSLLELRPGQAGLDFVGQAPRAASKEDCVRLALGLLMGEEHRDFSPRLLEEVAYQAALALLLVRGLSVEDLPGLMEESRQRIRSGMAFLPCCEESA